MSATLRLAVRKRAGARCEYCQLPDVAPHLMRFHLEHIRARRHGGDFGNHTAAIGADRR